MNSLGIKDDVPHGNVQERWHLGSKNCVIECAIVSMALREERFVVEVKVFRCRKGEQNKKNEKRKS